MSAPTPAPAPEEVYSIPASYRKMENSHILFWLVKDIAWCMIWRPLGMLMVVPTLGIALVIAWRTRAYKSELAHNLAIVFWITANSYWMTSEFFGFDTVQVLPHVTGKHLALVPFLIGLGILLYYYLVQKPRESRAGEVPTL
ncbi:hypothetical protein ACFQT0_21595 [Hymenobacter humi]|uniref:Uncharacterized protein n=1 Tax=Hymenobacter humi TaxID=1411620 RepID=A0ABW2UBS5_9BACT